MCQLQSGTTEEALKGALPTKIAQLCFSAVAFKMVAKALQSAFC